MSKQSQEDLSCLMDGELSDSEARFLIRRLTHDDELKATWARWHQCRDATAGVPPTAAGLLGKVSSALVDEPAVTTSTETSTSALGRWFKPLAGLGVAAAVAMVAINLSNNPLQEPTAPPTTLLAADETPAFPTNVAATAVSSSRIDQPVADQRLQEYLMRHKALSPTRRAQGLVDYRWVVVQPVNRTGAATAPSTPVEVDQNDDAEKPSNEATR